MEELVSLCKRRGFVFPSSEIYGGFAAVYDYGPLGIELKNNLKNGYCLIYSNRKLTKASKYKKGKKIKEWKDFSSFKNENSLNDLR